FIGSEYFLTRKKTTRQSPHTDQRSRIRGCRERSAAPTGLRNYYFQSAPQKNIPVGEFKYSGLRCYVAFEQCPTDACRVAFREGPASRVRPEFGLSGSRSLGRGWTWVRRCGCPSS